MEILIILAVQKAILEQLVRMRRITKFEAEQAYNILLENSTFLKKSPDISST